MSIPSVLLEICAGSVTSCLAAQAGGASRVEFCDNLLEGGTTPSYGAILSARDKLQIALNVIIRPRGGDFLYSGIEFEVMERDIRACKELGVDGVVLGLLTADGDIDVSRTRQLVELAAPMAVTFHRAFDVARDPFKALEDIVDAGCSHLLTSGQEATAPQGAALINKLREAAGERMVVMPGAGVRLNNIAQLVAETGCIEYHTSARAPVASGMRYRNQRVKMGGPGQDEYAIVETSAELVKQIIAKANDG
ncbi:copper homeostasis protein CutC [Caballeronia sordidicola]|jgi:copper homeostasis protein|uniref:PF03932 family protein CutC n=1 Tax=Caballeronia sordidicola TaxID=196367 RepID=A0A242MXB4_CABSO|nr:copper homeostasis protein CutC [Caballeronia sordidicola]OTP76079.1 Cytoplasmic copper homeostasis protein cutC [Caballeronia sordidicola]